VQRRGLPYKLYTDQGKPFTNKHTQIICANLGIRLLHAKPYCAWSKGKVERCFYTLQQGFESALKLPGNGAQSLEELNQKLAHWIQTVYHLRPHSSTGVSPQVRFGQAAGTLRHLEAGLELEALFFTRLERTVRKDGTVRIEGKLYEVDSKPARPGSAVTLRPVSNGAHRSLLPGQSLRAGPPGGLTPQQPTGRLPTLL
jgi:putative transposase